jgi:hypothetical protein
MITLKSSLKPNGFIAIIIAFLMSQIPGLIYAAIGDTMADSSIGIGYRVTSEVPAEVCVYAYTSALDKTNGELTIPSEIICNNQTYAVTSIASRAFMSSDIKSIVLPESLITIESNAFAYTRSLTQITFGNNLRTIGNNAFAVSAITEIYFPASLRQFGSDNNPQGVCRECSSLTNVSFAKNSEITSIPTAAFNECTALKEITLGRNISSIGESAFNKCSSLQKITVYSTTPPDFLTDNESTRVPSFCDTNTDKIELYVPEESLSEYKNSTWTIFSNIQAIKESSASNIELITLSPTLLTLEEGSVTRLTATITPTEASSSIIKWSSSNSNVADVDQNGYVSGINAGECIIYASSIDNNVKGTCAVTVVRSSGTTSTTTVTVRIIDGSTDGYIEVPAIKGKAYTIKIHPPYDSATVNVIFNGEEVFSAKGEQTYQTIPLYEDATIQLTIDNAAIKDISSNNQNNISIQPGIISITDIEPGVTIELYDTNGKRLLSRISSNDKISIPSPSGIVIISIAHKAYSVLVP